MLRDFLHWAGYCRACRIMKFNFPRMAETYKPLSFVDWKASEIYYRPSWKQLLFPAKVQG